MEKVTINNEVVLMRKFVKQAKIRAINGYTKEIRKLQNRKGSDDSTSKFKRKAERLLAKVAILRKMHPDSVSRKALAKEKDWQAVLKEKNIPLEDQCYALLANYAAVQSEVERFRKKYWDLVPKMPTFFKDWDEKSKDPMSKQEKKKAKQLRKSMKNVKLDKNNPNAVPVGSKNDADAMKNNISTTKNAETNANIPTKLTAADSKQSKDGLVSNHSKTMSSTAVVNNAVIKKVTANNTTKDSKVVLGPQKKNRLQAKQLKPAGILSSKKDKFERRISDGDDSYEIEKEINSEEEEVKSDEELNSEEEVNSEDVESTEEMNSEEEELGKSPLKFQFGGSTNIKNNKDVKMSSETDEDICSETTDLEENLATSESDSDIEKEVAKAIKEKFNIPKFNTNAPKPAKNSQDIRSRLQALAENKLESDIKRKRQKKTNSSKPVQENKVKAVAMLNLNELLGLDEFPVERADDTVEESSEAKIKKDPFFLGKNGEVISESEEEDSTNPFQAKDKQPFKKKKMDDFAKRSNGDSFKGRNFPANSSQNSRSSFKEKDFPKNQRNSNFEDKNGSFKNRTQRRFDMKNKGFQNKSFGENIPSKHFKPNTRAEKRDADNFLKNKTPNSLTKNPVDDKPLHPSWEAKKKLKEAASSKFQGKRIVFDD